MLGCRKGAVYKKNFHGEQDTEKGGSVSGGVSPHCVAMPVCLRPSSAVIAGVKKPHCGCEEAARPVKTVERYTHPSLVKLFFQLQPTPRPIPTTTDPLVFESISNRFSVVSESILSRDRQSTRKRLEIDRKTTRPLTPWRGSVVVGDESGVGCS